MQITLPDELNLPARAAAAGFSRPVDYVRHLVARDAPAVAPGDAGRSDAGGAGSGRDPRTLSYSEWRREYDALRAMVKPRGGNGDYSREAIYATDEELLAREPGGEEG